MNREAIFHLASEQWHYVQNETRGEQALYAVGEPGRVPLNVIADHQDLVADDTDRIEAWKTELLRTVETSEVGEVRP